MLPIRLLENSLPENRNLIIVLCERLMYCDQESEEYLQALTFFHDYYGHIFEGVLLRNCSPLLWVGTHTFEDVEGLTPLENLCSRLLVQMTDSCCRLYLINNGEIPYEHCIPDAFAITVLLLASTLDSTSSTEWMNVEGNVRYHLLSQWWCYDTPPCPVS